MTKLIPESGVACACSCDGGSTEDAARRENDERANDATEHAESVKLSDTLEGQKARQKCADERAGDTKPNGHRRTQSPALGTGGVREEANDKSDREKKN
jgi:hypothetical protein